MDKEIFKKEKEKFEQWFWQKGKRALLEISSPSGLMLVAWIARAELERDLGVTGD